MADKSDQSGLGAEMVRQVAERGHSLADYLELREPGDLIDDLRNWARRRPGGFLAGSALAGVVAGRLTRGVKDASSAEEESPSQVRAGSTYPSYSVGAGTGSGSASLGVAPVTGLETGRVDSTYASTGYREPLADDGPLYEEPTVAPHRPIFDWNTRHHLSCLRFCQNESPSRYSERASSGLDSINRTSARAEIALVRLAASPLRV
jgi:hypothetical protein